MKSCTLIITAGGLSTRFGKPKLFIEVNGQPLLLHTLKKFISFTSLDACIITMNTAFVERTNQLIKSESWPWPIHVIEGGRTRKESVQKGVDFCDTKQVLIHDAARPNTSQDVINRVLSSEGDDAVIPVISMTDTIKKREGDYVIETINRSSLVRVQTPQLFTTKELKACYQNEQLKEATDEAMLIEAVGKKVRIVEGDLKNIKVTYPQDLTYFQYLLNAEPH